MLKLCKRWRAYGCMMENIWMHSNAMRSCEFKRINGKRSVILHSVKTRCITDNIIVHSFGDSAVTNAERRTPNAENRRQTPRSAGNHNGSRHGYNSIPLLRSLPSRNVECKESGNNRD